MDIEFEDKDGLPRISILPCAFGASHDFIFILHHFLFQSWRNCDGCHFNEKIRLCNSSQWVHRFGLRYIFYLLAPIGNFCLFWASFWNKSRRLQNQCESYYLTLIKTFFLFRHLLCWWLKVFHVNPDYRMSLIKSHVLIF